MGKSVASVILREILGAMEGVDFFFGGSVRFGYDREDSDTDVFVLARSREAINKLAESFLERPGRRYNLESDFAVVRGKYPFTRFRFMILDQPVDFLLAQTKDEAEFVQLKKDHDLVEAFLVSHPDLREFCRFLGSTRRLGKEWITGAYKFRALLDLAKKGAIQ